MYVNDKVPASRIKYCLGILRNILIFLLDNTSDGYSMYAVKQERFLDDFDKMPDEQSKS